MIGDSEDRNRLGPGGVDGIQVGERIGCSRNSGLRLIQGRPYEHLPFEQTYLSDRYRTNERAAVCCRRQCASSLSPASWPKLSAYLSIAALT